MNAAAASTAGECSPGKRETGDQKTKGFMGSSSQYEHWTQTDLGVGSSSATELLA